MNIFVNPFLRKLFLDLSKRKKSDENIKIKAKDKWQCFNCIKIIVKIETFPTMFSIVISYRGAKMRFCRGKGKDLRLLINDCISM